jgi:hypothetical protein
LPNQPSILQEQEAFSKPCYLPQQFKEQFEILFSTPIAVKRIQLPYQSIKIKKTYNKLTMLKQIYFILLGNILLLMNKFRTAKFVELEKTPKSTQYIPFWVYKCTLGAFINKLGASQT